MGNTCVRNEDGDPGIQRVNSKQQRNSLKMGGLEVDKISQIKQFLTLTSQNTPSLLRKDSNSSNAVLTMKIGSQQRCITDFKVIRGLGRGAFGQVLMVQDKINGLFYAMKIIQKNSITCSEQIINTLSERYILQAMDHPFIVKLHYAFQSERKLYLLCDLMSGGELFYLLRRNKKFNEEVAKFFAAEILLAIEYLHSRNIIYRDLKPENILLDQQGHIKITDFGLSKVCNSGNQLTFSVCGTPQYIAPEVMLRKGYTQAADWFSFGSLLFDMLTGKPPFYSHNKKQILKSITTKTVPIPQTLSTAARSLLNGLFKIKPKERLGSLRGAQELKQHPFFANVDFDLLLKRQIKAPMSFNQLINDDGFDLNFQPSCGSTVYNQRTNNNNGEDKGLVFDGFTYNPIKNQQKTQQDKERQEINQSSSRNKKPLESKQSKEEQEEFMQISES